MKSPATSSHGIFNSYKIEVDGANFPEQNNNQNRYLHSMIKNTIFGRQIEQVFIIRMILISVKYL